MTKLTRGERPRWGPGRTMAALMMAAVTAGACGSEVVIADEDDETDLGLPIGEAGGDPGDVAPGFCIPCNVANCDICEDVSSATHRCNEGQPAPECIQLGGIFDDGQGYYTCWSCL